MRYAGSSISKKCAYCSHALSEIDYYGEALLGCIECNRWGRSDDKRITMEFLEDDLEALKTVKKETAR